MKGVSWLLLAGLAVAGPLLALEDPVEVSTGLLDAGPPLGGSIKVYKGIPYASPPTGSYRWRPPEPPSSWTGVRDASAFGPACMQAPGQGSSNLALLPGSPPMDEDCLYLNVWTGAANDRERRPVMVWIYGGAFSDGAGSIPLYDGETLARKGAIVVTFNYRGGAFGFLAHPALSDESPQHSSGNYGLMDMLAALRWVRENISAFGGDPDNVTVFGQSAGAMALSALVASPEAAGLFQRVIVQSGGWMGLGPNAMRSRSSAESDGLAQGRRLNAVTADELRRLDARTVAEQLRGAGLIVDGWIVPEDASRVFSQGRQLPVDILAGYNRDEGNFTPAVTAAQWQQQLQVRWGEAAPTLERFYPATDDASALASSRAAFRDGVSWHMRLFAAYQASVGAQAWVYEFAHQPPAREGTRGFGAVHAAELPYVFGNLQAARLYPDNSSPELAGTAAADRILAERMATWWVNFARSGNPNASGQPAWPPYRNMNDRAMVLGAEPAAETGVQTALWLRYNQRFERDILP